ncbi:LuxR C-terminal-related transcriptional regulator [Gloeothece verrucosa]|uniref:Two component transcriptional regulator, LuxR family n=1 Tax=Gloeothece verrucosa (strain PCC 7822) TaxID=497965 RepID=E0UC22_GLOV7|nr:response regulator transcription factor [Gloeothece verrucosa]ADN16360.1 two component transcriptional regulator, LuxR family [Gloeothece verrucosa PCC 7822]
MFGQPYISTVLVDDESLFRENLKTLLKLYSSSGVMNLTVIGETDSAAKAINLVNRYHPHLMLLDLELEQESGLDILKYLQTLHSSIITLVLSAHQEDNLIFEAMQSGAKGYIFKMNIVQQLGEAINTVMNDKVYFPPEVATQFFHYFNTCSEPLVNAEKKIDLTRREKEVLQYLIKGLSNEQIAQQLYITVATVKAHLTAIFNKLGVKNRTQAIVAAMKVHQVSANLTSLS